MEQLLTPELAAEKLAVSVKTVKNLLRSGKLRRVKVGNLCAYGRRLCKNTSGNSPLLTSL